VRECVCVCVLVVCVYVSVRECDVCMSVMLIVSLVFHNYGAK